MTEKLELATFDRLINIHQSFKLEQVVELNKGLLNAQLRTNQKLNLLNNQLAEANNLTRQILTNQISELKREEAQRFYKALSHYCLELIDKIEHIEPSQLKAYFAERYYDKLRTSLETAKENLEEISDKQLTGNLIKNLSLFSNLIESPDFSSSTLFNLKSLIEDYNLKENSHDKELKALNVQLKSINIPKAGLFGFNKKAMLKSLTEKFDLEEKYKSKLTEKEEDLLNHPLIKLFENISNEYEDFDRITKEIELIDNNFKKRFEHKKNNTFYDRSLVEAMKIILIHRQNSTSLIQRKLKLGYNRATKIIEQLEEIGAINKDKININTIEELNELLKQNYA
jgi:hypothetical protein